MKRGRRVITLVGAVCGAMLLLAVPAGATNLVNCQGTGDSKTPAGAAIAHVDGPSPATGTQSNPFLVDYDGTVVYQGSSTPVLKNHSWTIELFGIPVKSGGSPNASGTTTANGTVKVSDYLPIKITGLYHVSGSISGDNNASCSGDVWVKLAGSPVGTLPWFVGLAGLAGGAALMVFALPLGAAGGAAAAGGYPGATP